MLNAKTKLKKMGVFADPSHLMTTIKYKSAKGGFMVITGKLADQLLRLISTIILARLLLPEDFGLIAMITAITSLMMFFSDLGLSHATIQRKNITVEQVNALFWINMLAGFIVMLISMSLTPLMVWFYKEPRLMKPMLAISTGFFFIGISIQHRAILQRHMRFATLAVIDIISILISVIAAIISGYAGLGVWALVILILSNSIFRTAGVLLNSKWKPGWPWKAQGVKKMLAFGGNLTGFNLINHFTRQADHLLIGRYWGPTILGFYNRAYSLLLLPIKQITIPAATVAIPTLSRLQNNPSAYKRYYTKAVALIAFITVPTVAFLIIYADQLILIALGDKWLRASKIFSLLGLSGLIQPIISTNGWLYVSSGRTDKMLKWGIFSGILVVASFFLGLPYGAVGVAAAYSATMILLAPPAMIYACASTPVKPIDIVEAIKTPFISTAIAAMPLILMRLYAGNITLGFSGIIFGSLLFGCVYLFFTWTAAGKIKPIPEFINFITTVVKRTPVSAANL